jgi:hypothetical protein
VKKVGSGEEVFCRCWDGGEGDAGGCEENERGDGNAFPFSFFFYTPLEKYRFNTFNLNHSKC